MANIQKTTVARSNHKQIWIGTFWESPGHRPTKSFDYDYTISYRADATFPNFHMVFDTAKDIEKIIDNVMHIFIKNGFPSFNMKKENAMMSVWISNCGMSRTSRLEYVTQLEKLGISIASYGRCHHNTNETNDKNMLKIASKHLFFYAAENDNCAYYHTEKVYHGLLSGSLPIYLGYNNTIDEYVPKNSIVKISDFSNLEKLANYMKKLSENKNLYNNYFEWHKRNLKKVGKGLLSKLESAANFGSDKWKCDFCKFLHIHGRNEIEKKNIRL